jgi:hypothetical protein
MVSKTISLAFAIFAGMTLFLAVTAQDVEYDFVAGTDFSSYKTYKWQRAENTRYPNDTIDQIFVRSVDEQLAKKGLSRTDSESADIYVIYQLAVFEDMAWSTFTTQTEWQGGANSLPGFRGATTNSSYMIRRGALIIDIYDVKQKKRVWQVQARKTLKKSRDPKKIEGNAKKAMAKIFSNYPPR